MLLHVRLSIRIPIAALLRELFLLYKLILNSREGVHKAPSWSVWLRYLIHSSFPKSFNSKEGSFSFQRGSNGNEGNFRLILSNCQTLPLFQKVASFCTVHQPSLLYVRNFFYWLFMTSWKLIKVSLWGLNSSFKLTKDCSILILILQFSNSIYSLSLSLIVVTT
jgi:hypothetical protein